MDEEHAGYLRFPSRTRRKYEYIYCGKCKYRVTNACGKTKKRLYTCKYGHRHRFRAEIYVPGSGNKRIKKDFATRDYDTFTDQARNFYKSLIANNYVVQGDSESLDEGGNSASTAGKSLQGKTVQTDVMEKTIEDQQATVSPNQVERNVEDMLELHGLDPKYAKFRKRIGHQTFENVKMAFIDWLSDVEVEDHELKGLSEDYIAEVLIYLDHFAKAIQAKKIDPDTKENREGFDPDTLRVDEINSPHVGAFSYYLKNTKNQKGETFAISTYNKAMGFMRKFFKFLRVELGYNILDPFEGVGLKEPDPEPEMITLDEFNVLLALISKENGKARKEYPSGTRYYNHYTDWMSDAFRLFLETGERRDGIVLMKWNDINVKDGLIAIKNYKVSNIQKVEIVRHAPLTKGLKTLLKEMGWAKKHGLAEYIVAPEMKSRKTLKEKLTKAFTHYWELTEIDKHVTLKSLRKTYATLMYIMYGNRASQITGQDIQTILKYYLDKKIIVRSATNISLQEASKQLSNIIDNSEPPTEMAA